MKVYDKLNKAIAHFEGGFATMRMADDGELCQFTAHSSTFREDGAIILVKGEMTANVALVREHGLEEMFRRTINKIPA